MLSDGVYEVDGTPTDCVNIAISQLYSARPSRHRRVRHQQGLQPWRRCDVFGDRGGRAGRRAAGDSGRRRVARAVARTIYDFRAAASAGAQVAAMVLARAHGADVPQRQRSAGSRAAWLTFQAKRNHVTVVSERLDPRDRRTTGSKKGRTSGSRTIAPTIRRSRTATSRSRRCSPISPPTTRSRAGKACSARGLLLNHVPDRVDHHIGLIDLHVMAALSCDQPAASARR